MEPTTNTCRIQDTLNGLNPGDRVTIFYKSGAEVTTTLVRGDYGARITFRLGGVSKYMLEEKQIQSIELIQRARPKLAVGDRFRYVGQAEEYIVLAANPNTEWVRAIHLGPYSTPFELDTEPIEKI